MIARDGNDLDLLPYEPPYGVLEREDSFESGVRTFDDVASKQHRIYIMFYREIYRPL